MRAIATRLALPSSSRFQNENGSSSLEHDISRDWQYSIPWPIYHRLEEEGGLFPWRLFEERVRTGPFGLIRFPSQPHSPVRILVVNGNGGTNVTNNRVSPRLRQFIQDSPPRIRGEWNLGLNTEPEDSSLTDDEFKKAMKKLRKQVYSPYPRKKAFKRGIFSGRGSSAIDDDNDEKDDRKDCTICLEAFVPSEQVLVTPCNHMFHKDCIIPWVKSRSQCPVCRFVLYKRSETSFSRNNNSNNNNSSRSSNNNTSSNNYITSNTPDIGDDAELRALIRAMEEAFNWVTLSRAI